MGSDFLGIAVTGLQAAKTALATISHNVSNVNTPGYSRQTTNLITQQSSFTGGFYVGSGVGIYSITRSANDMVNRQLRESTSSLQSLQTLYESSAPVDKLLSDQQTGLTNSLDSFYSALQAANADPSSVASRTAFISQAQNLVSQFATISTQLSQTAASIDTGIQSTVLNLNSYAGALANVNKQISSSGSVVPADLLDQRDQILQEMSADIGITVTTQPDQTVNVFFGSGQALVVGGQPSSLRVQAGADDPQRVDVAILSGSSANLVQRSTLQGGVLGGLVNIRQNVIEPTQRSLGLVAIGLQDTINRQSRLGIDSSGNLGGNFFTDINDSAAQNARAFAETTNAGSAVLSVAISNVSQLSKDDYELVYNNLGSYSLTNLTTNQTTNFSSLPASVLGMTINLNSGSSVAGDRYLISPTRNAATTIAVSATSANALALGDPIRTSSATQNSGTGKISVGQTVDVSNAAFAVPLQLTPPVQVKFLSPTTYQVLNATTGSVIQAGPVPYSPQQNNTIFPVPGMQVGNPGALANSGSLTALAGGDLTINGIAVPAAAADGVSTTDTSSSALAIATAINSVESQTGVRATISPASLNLGTYTPGTLIAGNLAINGQNIIPAAATQNSLITQINTFTGTTGVSAAVDSSNNIVLTAQDGRNIQISNTLSTGGGGAAFTNFDMSAGVGDSVQRAAVTLSDATGNITIAGANPGRAQLSAGTSTNYYDPGYRVNISGAPAAGDTFNIDYNTNGVSDNRNGVLLARSQIDTNMLGSTATLNGVYTSSTTSVANIVHQADLQSKSASALNLQLTTQQQSISSVNLDEEATKLIRFQDAYRASAQVIQVTGTLMTALFSAIQ